MGTGSYAFRPISGAFMVSLAFGAGGWGAAEPGRCPLLKLETPHVVIEPILDPVDNTLCGHRGALVFELCRPARVTLRVEGQPTKFAVNDGEEAAQGELLLPPGRHEMVLGLEALGNLVGATKPFTLVAKEVADSAPATTVSVSGDLHGDILNRAAFAVGRTFVKGVDLLDGHLMIPATDIKLPGRHIGLEVTRTYSSAARGMKGAAGAGWSFNYASRLIPDEDCGLYVVIASDGTSQVFRGGGETLTPQRGYHTRLSRNSDGSFDFILKGGMKYHFGGPDPLKPRAPRRLEYLEEPHGDRIEIQYDAGGSIRQISEAHPERGPVRTLVLSHTQAGGFERIRSVQAVGLGLRADYEYDSFGNLVAVRRTEPGDGGSRILLDRYQYSTDDPGDRHQLLVAIDPYGSRTRYHYYGPADSLPGEDGDLLGTGLLLFGKQEYVKQIDDWLGFGSTSATTFSYDYSRAGEFRAVVASPGGSPKYYTLNADGSPIEMDEPAAKGGRESTRMRWAADDIYKVHEVNNRGYEGFYRYDERGNLVSEIWRQGGSAYAVKTFTYEASFNKLTSKRDAEGRLTRYQIDPRTGDLTGTTDAEGNVTRYVYDPHGLLIEEIDPSGATTRYGAHDTFGKATLVTDPGGESTRYQYDVRGKLAREIDHQGRVKTPEGDRRKPTLEPPSPGFVKGRTLSLDEWNLAAEAPGQDWEWLRVQPATTPTYVCQNTESGIRFVLSVVEPAGGPLLSEELARALVDGLTRGLASDEWTTGEVSLRPTDIPWKGSYSFSIPVTVPDIGSGSVQGYVTSGTRKHILYYVNVDPSQEEDFQRFVGSLRHARRARPWGEHFLVYLSMLLDSLVLFLGAGAGWLLSRVSGRALNPWSAGCGAVVTLVLLEAVLGIPKMSSGLPPAEQGELVGRLVIGPALFPLLAGWLLARDFRQRHPRRGFSHSAGGG